MIYAKDKGSPEYRHTKQSISNLEAEFRNYVEQKMQDPEANRGVFGELKKQMKDRKGTKGEDMGMVYSNEDYQKMMSLNDVKSLLEIPDSLLNKFNPLELYHFSELQLELEQCDSEFMVAQAVGASKFLKVARIENLLELEKVNDSLFKHINAEKLSKRGEGKVQEEP